MTAWGPVLPVPARPLTTVFSVIVTATAFSDGFPRGRLVILILGRIHAVPLKFRHSLKYFLFSIGLYWREMTIMSSHLDPKRLLTFSGD